MRWMIGLAASLVLAGGSLAQEEAETKRKSKPDSPPLAGPKVEDNRLPGVEESLNGAVRMTGMSERPVPMQIYRNAFALLEAESAGGNVRLSDDQQAKLRELGQEHAAAMREHMAKFQDEIAQLRRAAQAQQGSDRAQADAPQRGGRDAASRLRARLGQIRRQGPNELALQTRMWTVLSDAQKEVVEAEIDVWRDQMAQQRMDQSAQRYMEQRRQAAQDQPIQRRGATDLRAFVQELPPKLRESIMKLEPDARMRLFERLRERSVAKRDAAQEGASDRAMPSRRPGSGG